MLLLKVRAELISDCFITLHSFIMPATLYLYSKTKGIAGELGIKVAEFVNPTWHSMSAVLSYDIREMETFVWLLALVRIIGQRDIVISIVTNEKCNLHTE